MTPTFSSLYKSPAEGHYLAQIDKGGTGHLFGTLGMFTRLEVLSPSVKLWIRLSRQG